MKEFEHIRIEHVKCLSWWFWTRESFSAINYGIAEIFSYPINISGIKEWSLISLSIPYAYLICCNLAAAYRKKYVTDNIKAGHPFLVYNKNNIEYFAILEKLCGGQT